MGVMEDVINYLFGVLAGAGLQEEVCCLYLCQPLLGLSILREHHFQFIGAVEREACPFLWRAGNPINTVRQRVGAVGLDEDRHAHSVQSRQKGIVHLQCRFAAGENDEGGVLKVER